MTWYPKEEQDYDYELRRRNNRDSRTLTEKEQKDLTLWDKIRYYEKMGRLKNKLRKLMGAEF